MTDRKIKVVVWNEFRHEKTNATCKKIYPEGMHAALAAALQKEPDLSVQTATLDEPEHGLTQQVLENADVLLWWGHAAHNEVRDEVVDRIQTRILSGLGLIVLHSGHCSKIFRRMMGTSCLLRWREAAEKERLWVVDPTHPIAAGIGPYIELPHTEMYGEHFDVPPPDELVFISWFEGGEVFRSGATWKRGLGKIFYFRPGHETYPIYHQREILKVITNAVRWTAFCGNETVKPFYGANTKPLETIPPKNYQAEAIAHPSLKKPSAGRGKK